MYSSRDLLKSGLYRSERIRSLSIFLHNVYSNLSQTSIRYLRLVTSKATYVKEEQVTAQSSTIFEIIS